MRWNDGDQWIYSEKVVHPALVSDGTFAEVQQMTSPPMVARAENPAGLIAAIYAEIGRRSR
jgi:hypothetical protein